MTREQKIKKRIERANKRRKIRQDIYLTRKNTANHYGVPLSAVNKDGICICIVYVIIYPIDL